MAVDNKEKEKKNDSRTSTNTNNKEQTIEKANVTIKKKSTAAYLSEETEVQLNQLPNLQICNLKFLYNYYMNKKEKQENVNDGQKIKQELLKMIEQENMSLYYKSLCDEFDWKIDPEFLATMDKYNAETLEKLEVQLKDAEENLGEIEILDLFLSHAFYYTRIGDSHKSLEILQDIYENKKPSLHQKIQIYFYLLRTYFFFIQSDVSQRSSSVVSPKAKGNNGLPPKITTTMLNLKTMISKCMQLIDEGGDWDYRNRLKVYEGLSCIINRNFKKAVQLLNESIATFTCTELITYENLIFYSILMNILTSDRQVIKKQLITSSDVLMVLNEKPVLKNFLYGFYYGEYQLFFHSLVEIIEWIEKDMFLFVHKAYILRELRILAYDQYLNAYQSVTLDNMSHAFGLSSGFLDRELSYFISYGKLSVKIDKVNGIIITNPKDRKNMKYNEIIKKGDLLLNRIQRLSRIVNV